MLLPDIRTIEDYRQVYRDPSTWLPAMQVICEHCGLDRTRLELAPPGSHVVFRAKPDLYIKLFAPLWRDDYTAERLTLHKLSQQNNLPIPIPLLVAQGEIEGWPYIVVTSLEGVPLNEVWNGMSMSDKEHVATCCGEYMASVHSIDTEGLEEITVCWPALVDKQLKECIRRLPQAGIDEGWSESIRGFIEYLPPLFEQDFRPVLLNSDLTDEHILVSRRRDRWVVTGLIDFGDAMVGHPHYEFAAPVCSITRESVQLRRAMLLAYGYSDDQLNEVLSTQLMAYTLVHKFITIQHLLEIFGSQRPESFDSLRKMLWSFQEVDR